MLSEGVRGDDDKGLALWSVVVANENETHLSTRDEKDARKKKRVRAIMESTRKKKARERREKEKMGPKTT